MVPSPTDTRSDRAQSDAPGDQSMDALWLTGGVIEFGRNSTLPFTAVRGRLCRVHVRLYVSPEPMRLVALACHTTPTQSCGQLDLTVLLAAHATNAQSPTQQTVKLFRLLERVAAVGGRCRDCTAPSL